MTHGRPAWYDIEMRGRRLESIISHMNTKFRTEKNPELALAYLDRLIRVEHAIQPYVEQITGLKKFLKKKEKKLETKPVYS